MDLKSIFLQFQELVKREVPFIQKFYTKTLGQIKFDRQKGRIPAKGSILECVVKCSATYGCHCIRYLKSIVIWISIKYLFVLRVDKQTNECNTFVSAKDDPNSERNKTILDQYVYFTSNGDQDDKGGKNLTTFVNSNALWNQWT